jgi:two-component system, response regulator, stage 0 sporulation protein F
MKTILVTEDEELLSEIYRDTLEKEGYRVLTALTGSSALSHLEAAEPDLVILDIKLPDMSGAQVLEAIRKKYPDLPVIMCTAYDTFRDEHEFWSSKISYYIVKPVVLDDLKGKIRRILKE